MKSKSKPSQMQSIGFVSAIDKFLAELDQKFPQKSASQLQEITKANRIMRLRDGIKTSDEKTPIPLWEDF